MLFPKMIKEISFESLLVLKKHRNSFILFWILYFATNFLNENWILLGTPIALVLSMLEFGFLICSAIFLVTTTNKLYKNPMSYIAIYITAIIAPLFLLNLRRVDIFIFQVVIFIDIFLKFVVFILVISDFECIFRCFQEGNKNSINKIVEKLNKRRRGLLIKESLILFAFIVSVILLIFVFPKIFPRLIDGWGGLIFAQIASICTSIYPLYILIKGTVIGIKNVTRRTELLNR